MKCLILAAGYSTRLYPLTENFPKPLLQVGKKSILDWLVDDLVENSNINEFIVVTNHKFSKHFEEWKDNKTKIRDYKITIINDGTLTNETRLGAVRDIELALDTIKCDEDLFIMAGDNVLDFSLKAFVDYFYEADSSCVMYQIENDLKKQQKTAIIQIDDHNKIISYEEKPQEPKANLAVPPFYIYKHEDLNYLKPALENGCNTDAPGSFAAWLSYKVPMHAYMMPGKRYDVGDLEGYKKIQEIFKDF